MTTRSKWRGRAMQAAWDKGYALGARGVARWCPYCADGRTFSTAFARAWGDSIWHGAEWWLVHEAVSNFMKPGHA